MANLQLQDRSKTYLLYAGVGGSSDTASQATTMAGYMRNMGFTKVYYMTPGTLTDWRNAGYPTTIMGPPLVVSTAPPNGATGVQLNSNITITFSEAMNTAVTEGAFSINPSVAGSRAWNTSQTAMTFSPASNLSNNTPYIATISTAATDTSSNHLAAPYSFSFSTASSAAIQVVTGLSTSVTAGGAIISGSLTGLGTSTNVAVSFEYGTSTSYGSTIAAVPATLTAPGTFTANVTGLASNQTYHFRARAAGSTTASGADASFITCSTAQQASALIANNASNPNFAIIDVRTLVEYAGGYIAGAINIDRNSPDFQNMLQPLDRNRTYLVYCGIGMRSAAARDIMASMGFQTIYTIVDGLTTWKALGYPLVVPPAVTTGGVSNIATTSAIIAGGLTTTGNAASVTVSFEYGTTTAYGLAAAGVPPTFTSNTTGAFTANLAGLTPSTLYHFRAKAVGAATVYGGDATFTTTAGLTVTTGLSTTVTAAGAVISGSLTGLGDATSVNVSFEFGVTTTYGASTANVTLTAPGTFTANVTGLASNQTYHFRARAAGSTTASGADASFITCSTAQQASALIANNASNPNFAIIDVRTLVEYAGGYIAGAINIDRNSPDFQNMLQPLDRNRTYLVYCGIGMRSAAARDIMASMGFQTIYTIVDGLTTWKALGYPLVVPPAVTTGGVSNIATTSAIIAGGLTTTGNAASVTVSFEYGTTTAYGLAAAGVPPTFTSNTTGAFTANLAGLTPSTLYHFRAKAVGAATVYGGDATFTTTAVVVTPPPVFSGGGFVPPPAPNVTVTGLVATGVLIVDNAGAVQDEVLLKTADGYVTVTIPKGSLLLDGVGQALKAINAKPLLSPPSAPATSAMLFAYTFDPSPAQFKPSITLTYRYDTQMIPEGIDPRQLYVAVWDGRAWQPMDSTVDAATTSVSVRLTQFSQYALLVKMPAPALTPSLTFTAFTITPSLVHVGDAVAVSVTCANIGNGIGTQTVVLKVNSVQEGSKVVSVSPGENQNVVFEVKKVVPGTYAVDVNGLTSQFTVQPAPEATTIPPPVASTAPAPTPKTPRISTSQVLLYAGLFAIVALAVSMTFLARRKKQ